MSAVLAAAIYSIGSFSLCFAISARRVMVPGESTSHLEPGKIHPCWNLLVRYVFDPFWIYRKLHSFQFVMK